MVAKTRSLSNIGLEQVYQAEEYEVQVYKGQAVECQAFGTTCPFSILDLI